jgi:hypothetical protein
MLLLLVIASLIVLSPLAIAPFVYRKEQAPMAILRFKQLNIGERFTDCDGCEFEKTSFSDACACEDTACLEKGETVGFQQEEMVNA